MFGLMLFIFVLSWVIYKVILIIITIPMRRKKNMTAAKNNYAQRMYGCNYDELPK